MGERIYIAKKDDIDKHANNTDNPHQVTKEQVGLGNVDNTADSEKPVSKEQQHLHRSKSSAAGKRCTGDTRHIKRSSRCDDGK